MKSQKRFYLFDINIGRRTTHPFIHFIWCESCAKKIFPIFHPRERQKTCSSSMFFPLSGMRVCVCVCGKNRWIDSNDMQCHNCNDFQLNFQQNSQHPKSSVVCISINWNILFDIFNEKFSVNSAKSTRHRYICRCIDRYSTLPTGTFWQTILCSPERKTVQMQCRSGKISWRVFDGGFSGVLLVFCVWDSLLWENRSNFRSHLML